MKKIIIIVIILLISISTILTVRFVWKKPDAQAEDIQLNSVSINGVTYQTSGAILTTDGDGYEQEKEAISLLDRGGFETQSFRFSPPGNGTLVVEIFKPYETNKSLFLTWLKENGYSHLGPDKFIFINLP